MIRRLNSPLFTIDSVSFRHICTESIRYHRPSPHRFCATSHRLCRIDCASSGRDATESIIQRVEGGGQETFCCRGFGGANNLPGDFQTFSYTLNGSHSHTVGATKKGGVQNRFVGALFRVLVFKRALFVHFQGKREMHEKQHFDKTNTLCIQISLIL